VARFCLKLILNGSKILYLLGLKISLTKETINKIFDKFKIQNSKFKIHHSSFKIKSSIVYKVQYSFLQ